MSSAAEVTTFTSGQMLDSARTLRSQPPHRAYAVVRILSTSACSSSLLFSYFTHTHPSALGRPIMSTRVGTSIGSLEVISAAGLVQDVHGAFSQLESGKRSGERGGEVVQNRVEEVKIPPIGRIITRLFGLTHFDQLSIRRGKNSCQIHCINAHTGLLFIQKQHQLDVT